MNKQKSLAQKSQEGRSSSSMPIHDYLNFLKNHSGVSGTYGYTPSSYENDFEVDENWDSRDSVRNILLFPESPTTVRNDVLAARQGGLVTDTTLRARVSVIVGPGATLTGIAQELHSLYVRAASANYPAPTIVQLAQALAVYSQYYLTMRTMARYEDGLRIPLPIEVDQVNGDWIVNSNLIRLWSRTFQPAWQPHLTQRPARLALPDLENLPTVVMRFLASQRTVVRQGLALQARAASNPFKHVFFIFESFKQLGANGFAVALAFLDQSVNHQLRLLATLSAGQAILRRLSIVLQNVPTGVTQAQQQSLTRGQAMINRAMRSNGNWVVRRELPETRQQLTDRGRAMGGWQNVLPNEPVGGSHRMVLGRDLSAGRIANWRSFRGPAYGGRISPTDFIANHTTLINPTGDGQLAARLDIVRRVVINEGFLDAVRLRDSAIVSLGIQQWSAHVNNELFSLLMRYKRMAPEEFMLFFQLYDFDVRTSGAAFRMQRIMLNDTRVDINTQPARRRFFGGAISGGTTRYGAQWAAKLRMPAVASLSYRAAQTLEAAARFDRIAGSITPITVNGVAVPLTTLITSEFGVALILDAHINRPGFVQLDLQNAARSIGPQPNDNARDQAISQAYLNIRRTNDTPARNANLVGQGLNVNHGSFNGW